jgi:NAD(P)-dependent dehydrogenase (short-subunit alcohol dehydrogenase family)
MAADHSIALYGLTRRAVDSTASTKEVKLSVPGLLAEEDFPPDLAGRRAVVTGAARGIGEAIAKGLISSGARVVAIDKHKDMLVSAYEGLVCETTQGDLAGENPTQLAKQVLQDGPVELPVNNVGITTKQDFWGIELNDLRSVYRTNVEGPWFFTRWLMEALVQEQQARSRRNERALQGGCRLHLLTPCERRARGAALWHQQGCRRPTHARAGMEARAERDQGEQHLARLDPHR